MAVNKNFVVKNGIEVNENLIVSNITDKFVGIGTSTPNQTLHVFGGIGATDVRVTGVSSFIQSIYVGSAGTTFAVVDTSGSNAQVGIGTNLPEYPLDVRSPVSTGQTGLYVQGDVRITGDIIADDLVFDQGNFTNLEVAGFTTTSELVVGYGASIAGITSITNTTSGVSTTTGALVLGGGIGVGGSIHLNDSKGIILGSGGDLQLVHDHAAGHSYIVDAGTGNLYIDATQTILQSAGSAKVTTTPTGAVVTGILTATGIGSFGSSVNVVSDAFIGGDLTVAGAFVLSGDVELDELTARNIDVTGIATLGNLGVTSTTTTQDLKVSAASTFVGDISVGGVVGSGLSVAGVGTFGSWVSMGSTVAAAGSIYLPNTKSLRIGDTAGGDLWVYHNGTDDYIRGGTGKFWFKSNELAIQGQAGVETSAVFAKDGPVRLYYNNSQKFYTTNTGVVISGISTADYFIGDGSNLTGIAASLVAGIGIGSESTPIGSGVTFLNVVSSTGAAIAMDPPTSGIATVTITPGASLGMVLALGG